jgi:hypothetical protein
MSEYRRWCSVANYALHPRRLPLFRCSLLPNGPRISCGDSLTAQIRHSLEVTRRQLHALVRQRATRALLLRLPRYQRNPPHRPVPPEDPKMGAAPYLFLLASAVPSLVSASLAGQILTLLNPDVISPEGK